ncbi:MAG TPA: nucleotide exchange factor GrpE [Pyrinomonadaceae bacterium]|nr:nucleotide exchange factor GrpE [Pyrinomonadaceae bacterium]
MDRLNPDQNFDTDNEIEDPSSTADDEVIDEGIGLEELSRELNREEGGEPDTATLVAMKEELKRAKDEIVSLKDSLSRSRADYQNIRKRTDKEKSETYSSVVKEIVEKLLPVSDNLKRALEAEASVEAAESDEFRHFLSGVDLVWKQLTGVLDALGVKPISAVGEEFNPHIHEAVVTEATDEYEPDTVIQEIRSGYRLGDKLIRPALVKVSTRK